MNILKSDNRFYILEKKRGLSDYKIYINFKAADCPL